MKRILIVDDSQLSRNYHSTILKSAGYLVETAAGGAEALEQMMRKSYDTVLTDINMRGMDGYEFIRRVRANGQLAQPAILIISTESSDDDKRIGFAAGANFYLVKPAEPEMIVESVRLIMETPG